MLKIGIIGILFKLTNVINPARDEKVGSNQQLRR